MSAAIYQISRLKCKYYLNNTGIFYRITVVYVLSVIRLYVCLCRRSMSGRRLPPVTQAVPKLPAVNEGSIIVDDTAQGDTGCVAIQQLYEDMRSDWTNGRHREKSPKNGLDRTVPTQVVCISIYTAIFIICTKIHCQFTQLLVFIHTAVLYISF